MKCEHCGAERDCSIAHYTIYACGSCHPPSGPFRSEICKELVDLRAIVDALPKCWRLKDGKQVQDVPVGPGNVMFVVRYDLAGDPIVCSTIRAVARDGRVLCESSLYPNEWFSAEDCYDSREAAEHAAKAKGEHDG